MIPLLVAATAVILIAAARVNVVRMDTPIIVIPEVHQVVATVRLRLTLPARRTIIAAGRVLLICVSSGF